MVSAGTKYGLRFAVELALHWKRSSVDAASAAVRRDIPEAYLRKIAAALRRAGLVEADRGQSGGYRLGRDPREISALDVFLALETPGSAPGGSCREIDQVWDTMQKAAHDTLQSINLADISASLTANADWVI